jgi:hypothetical protein
MVQVFVRCPFLEHSENGILLQFTGFCSTAELRTLHLLRLGSFRLLRQPEPETVHALDVGLSEEVLDR